MLGFPNTLIYPGAMFGSTIVPACSPRKRRTGNGNSESNSRRRNRKTEKSDFGVKLIV